MHTALLERSLESLKAVRRQVSFSSELRARMGQAAFDEIACEKCVGLSNLMADAPDQTSWKVIDHCIVVTRTYALFEAFIRQLLREYLSFLAASYKLSDLGDDFISRYTRGIGQVLVDQSKPRYEKIDAAALISDATAALASTGTYQIQPEAMLRMEQNLRMVEVRRIFANCGLAGIEDWVSRHSAVIEFFATQSRLSETAESELRQIVGYRNEAAHGDVDQVLGIDVLIELTEFFEALLRSITDFVQYDTLRRAKEIGKAQVIGTISERFREDIVVAKISNATLAIGDRLYIYGKGLTMIGSVLSIQLDDADQLAVTAIEQREVGLRLGVRAKTGCELIRFD